MCKFVFSWVRRLRPGNVRDIHTVPNCWLLVLEVPSNIDVGKKEFCKFAVTL